ncbi:MAG: F0F1 ATP synthase subunit A [Planctomycetes bacterium]|nr:F0F1 ATP synthase subunit A [Planctomycetota bacterium]MCH8210539.1 F0F1 ATP synthase subunit A [Planctomycetota bacterium]MCH8259112.1 F0F1 ATP synthase subunit A [Planctomycetota bacterium]
MYFLASGDPTEHVKDVVLWATADGTPLLTMHMVTIVVVTAVFVLAMMKVAKSIATGPESDGNERYITKGRFSQMIETMVIYLRDEMLEPVLGKANTKRYLPYLMTVFFFILFNNLVGLIPILDMTRLVFGRDTTTWFGGTATANIMVTGALASLSFLLIQIHGFRELGFKGWAAHLTGGLIDEPWYIWPVMLIVVPVELVGHLIKPMALAIRLFANMVAGHTLMAVLLGFGAAAAKGGSGVFGIGAITLVSGVAAVLVTFLELFVAFLQAFIFMFLTAVFMSLLSYHDEDHEHEHDEEPALEAAAGSIG